MNFRKWALVSSGCAALAAMFAGESVEAAVTISTDTTQNMSCASGVCAPTASNAVLNADDLENLLASGNVEVTTTGSGVQAQDIDVKAALSWSSTGALTLDAYRSIAVDQAVTVEGQSGLTLSTNDGGKDGELSFGKKGQITFAHLSSSLSVNGVSYTFESSIKDLASAIASSPSGNYALPNPYDAKADGPYTSAPIPTAFEGTFEGLGNAISNLTIEDNSKGLTPLGLFQELGKSGTIRDVGLTHVFMTVHKTAHGRPYKSAGALVGDSFGTVFGAWSGGKVMTAADSLGDAIGGLIGYNEKTGVVSHSHASAAVLNGNYASGLVAFNDGLVEWSYATGTITGYTAGGLVGLSGYSSAGQITQSFATGAVSGEVDAGGLVIGNYGSISDSYATGSVVGGIDVLAVGGVGSYNSGAIARSYSTGAVSSGNSTGYVGGLIGDDVSKSGSITSTYWDTDTSGISNLSQGAGNIANDPGITGLTTKQFQLGLPEGFDPKIWAEKSSTNGGLPYLRANPPK